MPKKQSTTSFGFKEVPQDLKQKLVNNVFGSVASKYDLMNDVMSFGIHRLWKKFLLNQVKPEENLSVLDMASGTGDIAFKIYRKLENHGYKGRIVLADISKEMLEVAEKRAIDQNILPSELEFKIVNGEKLDFPSNSFDYYIVTYGIRNFTDRDKALQEAYRVLKKGGRFLCLEFSQIPNPLLQKAYDFYSFNFIPKIGEILTGDKESYEYFIESIRQFPSPEAFSAQISNAGFSNVKFEPYTLGVTNLYVGEKE